jgi:hypothetical protein
MKLKTEKNNETIYFNIKNNFMKSAICLILLLSISLNMRSQCAGEEKLTCGGDWAGIDYIFFCPTYTFAFNGDTSKQWNILNNKIDIYQIKNKIFPVKAKIEAQILNYSGKKFFNDLNFVSVDVVFPDSVEKFSNRVPSIIMDKCKAKYFFYYKFIPIENVHYNIGIAVSEQGEILNKFDFSAKKDYKMIDKKLTICDVLEIAKKYEEQIYPIESIKLHYNEKDKKFYWLVRQGLKEYTKGTHYLNELLIDASNRKHVEIKQSNLIRDVIID